MFAKPLQIGDTIGIAAPSWLATREHYEPIFAAMKAQGYRVKPANHLYANGWGYAASDRERAQDLNQLICDDTVSMIFFDGGEGAEDVLPLIDFEAARAKPKIWCSYSDGTTILNAIWAKTGLVTYYGQMPNGFADASDYDREQFERHIVKGMVQKHIPNTPWRTLHAGTGTGTLMGGYLDNFIFLSNNGWFDLKSNEKALLFIEDADFFFQIEHESALLRRLELSPIMSRASGLLFGHYSTPINEYLMKRLARLGEHWGIPVCYCDDFGHGDNHAILPIGIQGTLDADRQTLVYHW